MKETEELKKRQATPDSPEALACIPSLQLSDIPKEAASIPTAVSSADKGPTLLTHDMFTNNVLYADIALPLNRVPARLLPLLPLFCRCAATTHQSFNPVSHINWACHSSCVLSNRCMYMKYMRATCGGAGACWRWEQRRSPSLS